MPCTTMDHTYPRPLNGGPVKPGTQCWCGKRIWGGPAAEVVKVPIIPRPSHPSQCIHTFDRDGDLGEECCIKCGIKRAEVAAEGQATQAGWRRGR